MIILGLHFGHDGSACIVRDGRLEVAISSERISRAKKSAGVPEAVLDAVLGHAGITVEDVDAVAITDWYSPWKHCDIECSSKGSNFTDVDERLLDAGESIHDSWDRIWDDQVWEMDVRLRGRLLPGYNVGHQKAHCASAFYTSPFEDAWCMSMDSSGAKPKNNFMVARGRGLKLDWTDTPLCMAGVAYGHFCDHLAIGAQIFKAGSLMALAGYGHVKPQVRENIDLYKTRPFFEQSGDYHQWKDALWEELSGGKRFTHEESDGAQARDIAATIQYIFEEAILHGAASIPEDGCGNICLSGGSFLNCNANARVLRESRFGKVHLFPGCSDDGCGAGAALYTAHHIFGEARGKYSEGDICHLGPSTSTSTSVDYGRVAEAIAGGKIVAWVDGRSEYGPRALGHRSLLADPRSHTMRDRINFEVKNREWYRPLSPSVLAEDCAEWFDFPACSPFMLFTAPALYPEAIPAVVHVDGTARMQTVTEASNPNYYRLISAFKALTGVPMVLNTSLNTSNEPIVESAEDARRFFETTPVEMLVLDGEVFEK